MTKLKLLLLICLVHLASGQLNIPEIPKGTVNLKAGTHSIPGAPKDFTVTLPKDISLSNIEKMDAINPKMIEGLKIGSGREYEDNGEMSCIYLLKRLAMEAIPAFNGCMKDMSLTIGKLKKKLRTVLPCMIKCIGIKLELLNPDGSFNVGYATTMLIEYVPPRMMEFVWTVFEDCMAFAYEIKQDDPTCETYRPIMKCALDSGFKIAGAVLEKCTDIPDVFKKMARNFTNSKSFQKTISKYIEPAKKGRKRKEKE